MTSTGFRASWENIKKNVATPSVLQRVKALQDEIQATQTQVKEKLTRAMEQKGVSMEDINTIQEMKDLND